VKILILILLIFALPLLSQTAKEKVKELNLPQLSGSVTTNYSKSFEQRAREVQDLLAPAGVFFEEHFGVKEDFQLAILDEQDWQNVTPIPYGLPFVSGPPNVVCMPASSDHQLAGIVSSAIANKGLDKKYGLSNKAISELFVALIGFHELGHVYARAYGISFPNKWTFEFAASYMAYYYLQKNAPRYGALWIDVCHALLNTIEPEHTSLADFEKLYTRVGIANYAWYQVVFLLQVDTVYRAREKNFLTQMRGSEWPAESKTYYLEHMNMLGDGFDAWAQKYKL